MTDVLADITRRLAAGETLEAITRSLRPPQWSAVLRVCAVARTFDSALYRAVLGPVAAGGGPGRPPALNDLIHEGAVHPVGGVPGTYTLPDTDRAAYFLDWIMPGSGDALLAPELLDLERRIAAHHLESGDHAEAVRHLLLPDPEAALALFEQRFAEADERRDFAACQDLVDVLGDADRLPHAVPGIADLGIDRAGYVRARDHWAADYARSAQFLQPKGLTDDAEELLSGGRRVWHVYAPGGRGKTMLLRWLVARYCVPAPHDVPCARIDFDVVNPHTVGRHPWLLLLEIAEQFGRRLPGRVFESLSGYDVYRILLDRRPSAPAHDVAGAVDRLDTAAVEAELLAAFADRLNPALAGRSALLVVDTTEELLLHGHPEAERMLGMLATLLQRCPGLRLILAGRYNLRASIPKAFRAFPRGKVKHIVVRPFTKTQSRAYLTRVRGITDRRLVGVATDKAAGLPFHLALLADLVEQEPDITPEELTRCDGPLVRYLIERVVQRIDDRAVRWLLRYGVIPRRLHKKDVFTVMRSWLAQGITDRSQVDDPRRDDHHLRGRDDVFPFVTDEPTDEELERAWQRLLAYAAKSSWVSRHPGDDDTVVFHINVLAPMRLLVSDHPVFTELHRAFAAHFDALAEADSEQYGACLREATYHRFQAGDPGAVRWWRGQVLAANQRQDMELVRELCEEVLGEEYLEGGQPRLRTDGRPLISRTAVVHAHLGVAMGVMGSPGTALRALASPSDPAWSEVERHLAVVDRLIGESDEPIELGGADIWLRVLLLIGRGDLDKAARLIPSVPVTSLGAPARRTLELLLTVMRLQLDRPEAMETYLNWVSTARDKEDIGPLTDASTVLARVLQDHGRPDEAVALLLRLVTERGDLAGSPESLWNRAMLALVDAELRGVAPASALDRLQRIDLDVLTRAEEVDACLHTARAHQLLGRSRPAFEALDRAERVAQGIDDSTRYGCLAEIALHRGMLQGRLLAVDGAERSFARAGALWSDLGYPDGHPRCLLEQARFLARDVGDLRRAAHALQRLRSVDTSGEHAVEAALLWHVLAGLGHEAPDTDALDVPLRSRKDLLDGGVPAVLADPGRATELAEALAEVRSPGHRLSVLAGLSLCATPERPVPELDLLRPVFAPMIEDEAGDLDHQVRLALLAEFERVCGRPETAARLVARACSALADTAGDDPLPKWMWAQAQIRCGGAPEREPGRSLYRRADKAPPLLRATAHWLVATTEPDVTERRSLLRAAAEPLSQVQRPSFWAWRILRSTASVTEDALLEQAAAVMAEALGYPVREPAPRSLSSTVVLSSAHDEVFRVDPGRQGALAPMPMAHSLAVDWQEAVTAHMPLLHHMTRAMTPVRALQVRADEPWLLAFPWELLFRHRRTALYRTLPQAAEIADVRAVQAALNSRSETKVLTDGVWGAFTLTALRVAAGVSPPGLGALSMEAALAALQLVQAARRRARERTGARAVVVACDPPAENSSFATSGYAYARSVLHAYTTRDVLARDVRSPGSLPRLKEPPDVLHVSAPLRLRGGATPCFDLSFGELSPRERLSRTATGADLDPGRLVEWLRQFEPGTQPLVVLDPPRPASQADIPLQLALRNLFAASLFSSGCAPAVLGVGLLGKGRNAQTNLVAQAVRAETPLLRLYEELCGRAPVSGLADWGEDELERHCVSLFASPAALYLSDPDRGRETTSA